MGVLDDLFGYVKEKANEFATGLTGLLQRIGQQKAQEMSQQTPDTPTGAEPPQQAVPEAGEARDDVEQIMASISTLAAFKDNGGISEELYRENLISIGVYAYNKMRQYQQLVRQIEEKTGVTISQAYTEQEIANIPREAIYEVQMRFYAELEMAGGTITDSRLSRVYIMRGNNEQIAIELEIHKREFLNSLPYQGRTVTSLEEEILSKTLISERSLQSFDEAMQGENYEL